MAKRLDRGLANLQWRLDFPEAFLEVLCRFHSDHNPLLLRLGGLPQARGPKPFRFEASGLFMRSTRGLFKQLGRKKGECLLML